jgi:hypothetical protein
MKAVRKPATVTKPGQLRASSDTSGIIVSASMAGIAPAASAVMDAAGPSVAQPVTLFVAVQPQTEAPLDDFAATRFREDNRSHED